jgi:hypothetical protein
MSRRCIGHHDGVSLWEDEGPGNEEVSVLPSVVADRVLPA